MMILGNCPSPSYSCQCFALLMETSLPCTGENSESDVHVHFKTEDVMKHESQIQVMEVDKGSRDVHLGFLQIHHVYDITFALPHSLGKDVEHDPLESLLVKVKDMTLTDEGKSVLFAGL